MVAVNREFQLSLSLSLYCRSLFTLTVVCLNKNWWMSGPFPSDRHYNTVWWRVLMTALMTGPNQMTVTWNREKVTHSVQKTTLRMIIATLNWTLLTVAPFVATDKTKWVTTNNSTDIRRRWQHILTKLLGVFGVAIKATTSFEAWYCFIAGEFLYNIIRHTEQQIFIIEHYVSRASDDQLTRDTEVESFIVLLCLAGAFRNKKQSVRIGVTNGYDVGNFRFGINQRPFKFLIKCFQE